MTFKRADIILPRFSADNEKMKKWSVVACDQYTSEPEYWEGVSACVGESPSTFKLTVPEIYLNDANIEDRIKNTNAVMKNYDNDDIFIEHKNTYIYVERILANGAKRLGVVGVVDLEDYDYTSGAQTKIRATEGTVISRIPPRLRVRCDALIELPHIMLLIDDNMCEIIESNSDIKESFEKLYDFDLMQNSGHITGYKMSEEASKRLEERLLALEDIDLFEQKYGVKTKTPLVFAMGDGNHSLATAKTHYENLKSHIGADAAMNSPARFALCELVNLHDKSLVFEAIHRVIFDTDGDKFLQKLEEKFDVSYNEDGMGQSFVLVYKGQRKKITIKNPEDYLTVATIQKFIDNYVEENGGEVDYIHGEDVVDKLCADGSNVGVILDAMDKSDLYKSVILDGALPRKTFSMGDACDKRFYIEARRIK